MARTHCNKTVFYFLTAPLIFCIFCAQTKGEITTIDVSNAWIRAAPGGARVLAGYFSITNNGTGSSKPAANLPKKDFPSKKSGSAATLIALSSPVFAEIMMHQTVIKDGLASMLHLEKLVLEPGQARVFKPGGMHLMMMQPARELKPNDQVPVSFKFESGQVITVNFRVRTH